MEADRTVLLPCPGCDARVPCTLVRHVDAAARPDLRAALLDWSLMRLTCASCGWDTPFDARLEYVDAAAGLHVLLETDAEALVGARSTASSLPRRRLVRSRSELVEKILLVDAGLDDRAVECAKAALRRDAPDYASTSLLFETIDGDAVSLAAWTDDGPQPVKISRTSFEALVAELSLGPEEPGFSLIDATWADARLAT